MTGKDRRLTKFSLDCGCSYMQDPNVREALKERAPAEASKIDGMVFGAFDK